MKKALIILGSLRKTGSTAILAAATDRALKEHSVETPSSSMT